MRTHFVLLFLGLLATTAQAQTGTTELDDQREIFKKYWGTEMEVEFDKLPANGGVHAFRVPYAGYIYPDNGGGTSSALRKYDAAFHGGRALATNHEAYDISAHTVARTQRSGFFGRRVNTVRHTPYWAGHCNGWTSAAIRHAEPQQNVTRNGVVFTPSDIKGLLAELYMYTDTIFLGGSDYVINPATLHLVVTNWIGRQSYPIGIESSPGGEVWNFPGYAYTTSSAKSRDGRSVEVRMNLGYKHYTDREYDKAPSSDRYFQFHYVLNLNEQGEIIGGAYYGDTSRLDFLWVPVAPTKPGEKGNESGNPYLKQEEVMAIWRDSVPAEVAAKWTNFDNPAAELAASTPAAEETANPSDVPNNNHAGGEVTSEVNATAANSNGRDGD